MSYFYGNGKNRFNSFIMPKALFQKKSYEDISVDAKILYGFMLERSFLSAMSGWFDDKGYIFIRYSLENIRKDLSCEQHIALECLDELEQIGLIDIVKIHGFMDTLYVRDFIDRARIKADFDDEDAFINILIDYYYPAQYNEEPTFPKRQRDEWLIQAQGYMDLIRENISLDLVLQEDGYPYKDQYEELYQLICDTVCIPRQYVRISGEEIPIELVKSKFLKINRYHIEYILDVLNKTKGPISNIRGYLLTSLYYAPCTMSNYYATRN